MNRPVAFFDIDGTVFRSSLLIEMMEALVQDNIFPPEAADGYLAEYHAWRNREGTYDAYIQAVITVYMEHIKGVHYGTVADIGRAMVADQSKHVYRYTRDLIQELRSQQYFVVAISQSPKTILDEFCQSHGFHKVYGRMYEIGPTDLFTGVITDEHLIANKANIIHRVLEKESVTLDGSIAVGDTDGDISMLELVERPICFNPNQLLYEQAITRGWEVVVERKDVIYDLQNSS